MTSEKHLTVVLVLEIVAHAYCGQNLALNKPAWMSTVYPGGSISSAAENSVDGHLGTNWYHGVCSATDENDRSPWIVIDLLDQYEIHNVTIYNRGDHGPERLHDFVIEVYRTNPSQCSTAAATVCKAYVGVFGPTGNVQCESPVLGRFVRIWKPTTLHYQDLLTVCEVEVYGIRPAHAHCGQNLALNKPAWMSTVYQGGSVSSVAENSVDGHLGTNWFHGVCSATADNDRSPWIVIDLLDQYEIHNVTIYNRGDDVPERLHDFIVEVYRTNPSRCSTAAATVCKAYNGVFNLTGNVQCESPVLGRFVRIWKPTTLHNQDLLTVCEVEVYGICPGACAPTWHQVVRGKHLLSPCAASFPQQSMRTCFLLCVLSDTCVSVNYNGGSKECQLISQPMPTDTVSSNQDWVFFGDDLC